MPKEETPAVDMQTLAKMVKKVLDYGPWPKKATSQSTSGK